MIRIGLVIFLAAMLAGCGGATRYQDRNWTGGLLVTQLNENLYSVHFSGNGFTHQARAYDFALLKASEITIQKGYQYFDIIDSTTVSEGRGPGFMEGYGDARIQFLIKEKMGEASVDADITRRQLREKYASEFR